MTLPLEHALISYDALFFVCVGFFFPLSPLTTPKKKKERRKKGTRHFGGTLKCCVCVTETALFLSLSFVMGETGLYYQ